MLIQKVEATAVSVPLGTVTSMSSRTVHAREYVIVTVQGDDGSIGTGYTYAGTTGGRVVRDIVLQSLAPRLLGRPAHDIEGAWKDLYQEALLIGRRGAALRSISALDIALFDLVSRQAGLPLAKFLGGWQDSVPAYASGGYYREGDPMQQLEREIRGNQALGFQDHKIKVGGRSVREDAARVKLARELSRRGTPLPRTRNVRPDAVPDGTRSVTGDPPRVGTFTSAPSAASGNVTGTVTVRWSPFRPKSWCFLTWTTT